MYSTYKDLKMDKNQREVTDNIRSAIKEKLKDMNTFVDDELPDYIMILIANKRSKHHMEKDLSLFLGSQTASFTNWLWELVNAIKAGSKVRGGQPSSTLRTTQHFENNESKETRPEEDDVLNYDPAEEGESLCLDEACEQQKAFETTVTNNKSKLQSETVKPQISFFPEIPFNPKLNLPMINTAGDSQLKATIKVEKPDSAPVQVHPTKCKSPGKLSLKSAKVYPIPVQIIKPVQNTPLEKKSVPSKSSEPSKSEYGGVSSVVCVTQRKYGGSAALQANKLLLRAVNDATRSVLKGRDVNEFYKPTPISELERTKSDEIVNENVTPITIADLTVNNDAPIDLIEEPLDTLINYPTEEQNIISEVAEQDMRRRVIGVPRVTSQAESVFEVSDILTPSAHPSFSFTEENSVTPHFIVTLDGVNFSSLKRKRSIISEEEPMEIDDQEDSDKEIDDRVEKKSKLAERCKYWPACKNSDECLYHHPTVPCKTFPNCKYGDKCLFIHPNCKFDALCSKKDCPFTHCSIRKYTALPTAIIKPVKIHKPKIVCKYFPRCTAKPCPYIHPKLCKFGTQCRAPKCSFGHFQIPNRDQLKWKAN